MKKMNLSFIVVQVYNGTAVCSSMREGKVLRWKNV